MKIKNRDFISYWKVLSIIREHVEQKKPLSLVRVGDGENICLAQKKVWPIKKVLATAWAKKSRTSNMKGVRLPNLKLRNRMITAIKQADIVGIPHKKEKEIRAPQKYLRPLTEKCFKAYKIRPKKVCHTFVNRHLPEKNAFWEFLRGRKILVISKWAKNFKAYVDHNYKSYNITIIPVRFRSFKEIKSVLEKVQPIEADLTLVSAGVNALILVDKLAHTQNRVAVDFGKTPMLITQKDKRIKPWKPKKKKKNRRNRNNKKRR